MWFSGLSAFTQRLLTPRAWGWLGLGIALSSSAADPVHGQALFNTLVITGDSCAGCHTPDPLNIDFSNIFHGRNHADIIATAIGTNTGGMQVMGQFSTADLEDIAAYLGNTPSSLSFGSIAMGSTSPAQLVTVRASTHVNGALNLSQIQISGDFIRNGGTCPSNSGTLAVGTQCTLGVSFRPQSVGALTGQLRLSHNGSSTPVLIALSGTGSASPSAQVSPASLNFSQNLGGTSAPQSISLSNVGLSTLVLSAAPSLSGAQAGEFSLKAGGSCNNGTTLAPGASCSVQVAFTPAALGSRSASLRFLHNGSNSPSSVSLNGTALAAAQAQISATPNQLGFGLHSLGSSSRLSVQVNNSGGSALQWQEISLSGAHAADFSLAGSCNGAQALPAGGSCTVDVLFQPSVAGTRSALLNLFSNAGNAPRLSLAVQGEGEAAGPAPLVQFDLDRVDFPTTAVGRSSGPRVLTLSNRGSAPLTGLRWQITPAEFNFSSNCAATLAAGSSCTVNLNFSPLVAGETTGELQLFSNAATAPYRLPLHGSASSQPVPVLAWVIDTWTLAFADTVVGQSAASQQVSLRNQGPGPVQIQGLSHTLPPDFVAEGDCLPSTLPLVLPEQSACTLTLRFQPSQTGLHRATLQLNSDGSGPEPLTLTGQGLAAIEQLAVSVQLLDFSPPASPRQSVNVRNSGNVPLQLTQLQLEGPFVLDAQGLNSACAALPFTLSPGQRCPIGLRMQEGTGLLQGRLHIHSSASSTPISITLQGQWPERSGSNVGGGGCSMGQGQPTGSVDWSWALLLLAAALRRCYGGSLWLGARA